MPYTLQIQVDLDRETANYLETCQRLSTKASKLQLQNVQITEFRKTRDASRRNNRTFLDGSKKGLRQVIVRNLYWDHRVTKEVDVERDLRTKFTKYGAVSKVYVHPRKPFGFVTFIDQKSVDELMRQEDHHAIIFQGNWLKYQRSLTKLQEDSPDFRSAHSVWLRVEGLGVTDKEEARTYFNTQVGPVEEIKIREILQTKQTYALIKFKHHDSVNKALIIKNHSVLGRSGKIYQATKSDGSKANSHEIVNGQSKPTNNKRNRNGEIQPPQKKVKQETGTAKPVNMMIKKEAIDNTVIGYFG